MLAASAAGNHQTVEFIGQIPQYVGAVAEIFHARFERYDSCRATVIGDGNGRGGGIGDEV